MHIFEKLAVTDDRYRYVAFTIKFDPQMQPSVFIYLVGKQEFPFISANFGPLCTLEKQIHKIHLKSKGEGFVPLQTCSST